MPYLQQFGVNRISPLNVSIDGKEKKEEAPASEIIEKNNEDSFAQVGKDIVNQVKDKWQNKSTLGKIGMVGRAVMSSGKSLLGEVDTSKLDQSKLDEAQDYVSIGSGAAGATGVGQIPSAVMDIANTGFSLKRAFDHFKSGSGRKGVKNILKGGGHLASVVPVVGEAKALQKTYKYTTKGAKAMDKAFPNVPTTPAPAVSVQSWPLKLTSKISSWLTNKLSD